MAIEKNAVYKVHNGVDFDTINFKTIASQVTTAGGSDVEAQLADIASKLSSVTNTMSRNDQGWWRDQKTGLIIQWGGYIFPTISPGSASANSISLPTGFLTKAVYSSCVAWRNASLGGVDSIHLVNTTISPTDLFNAQLFISDTSNKLSKPTSFQAFYLIIGY